MNITLSLKQIVPVLKIVLLKCYRVVLQSCPRLFSHRRPQSQISGLCWVVTSYHSQKAKLCYPRYHSRCCFYVIPAVTYNESWGFWYILFKSRQNTAFLPEGSPKTPVHTYTKQNMSSTFNHFKDVTDYIRKSVS